VISPKTPKTPSSKSSKEPKEHREHKEKSRKHRSSTRLLSPAGALPPVKEPTAFRMDMDSDEEASKPGLTRNSSLTNVYEALGAADIHAIDDSGSESTIERPRLRGKPAVYTQPLGPLIVPATPKARSSQARLFPSASAMALDLDSSSSSRSGLLQTPSRHSTSSSSSRREPLSRSTSVGALQKGSSSKQAGSLLPALSASKSNKPVDWNVSGSRHAKATRMWSGSGTSVPL